MAEIIPFLPRNPSDEALVHSAREQGLVLGADKWGYFYLQIADPPKDGTLNPHWVLAYVSKDEVVAYLRKRRKKHRELTAREIYGPILNNQVGPGEPK